MASCSIRPPGATATEKLVATLTGAPALTTSDLFHTSTVVTTYSGTITTGIALTNPATQRRVTVTGTVTNTSGTSGQGVFGNADFPWTVNNRGKIEATGTANNFGIQLLAGGTVNNLVAMSGTATPGSLIAGYDEGILIELLREPSATLAQSREPAPTASGSTSSIQAAGSSTAPPR